MSDPRTPSSTRFVILGMGRDEVRNLVQAIRDIAECEPLEGSRELVQLRVAPAPDVDSRTAWQRVRDSIAQRCQVMPVFEHDDGSVQFPTGTIHVRFAAQQEGDSLRDFAREHRLAFVGKNEHQPLQASFTIPLGETEYLPDIVARLDADSRTHAAWPEIIEQPKRHR